MRNDEIERLLGGYATGTLSEDERKILFEAALDDQELFNELKTEESLRDVLSDSDSRKQIELALREPQPERSGWWGRPWVWGLAGSFAMAAVLMMLMLPRKAAVKHESIATRFEPPAIITPVEPKTKPAAEPRGSPRVAKARARLEDSRIEPKLLPNASPPPEPPSQILALRREAAGSLSTFSSSMKVAGNPLRVTILRGESVIQPGEAVQAGDTIRFRVQPPIGGLLTISTSDDAGATQQLGPPLQVVAGQEYAIPPSPVSITATATFRITLSGSSEPVQTATIAITPGKPVVTR